jgi:hypothetical protein
MKTWIVCKHHPQDPSTWILTQPYIRLVLTPDGKGHYRFEVEPGFKWDGASRPWWLRAFLPRWGTHSAAALIHDWCYVKQQMPRWQADYYFRRVWREDAQAAGMGPINDVQRWLSWAAVRAFGWIYWRG